MIHDRGAIKWSSLMLPEHKRKLTQLYQEQFSEKRPVLDEQKQEEINRLLLEAQLTGKEIQVVFFHNQQCYVQQGKIKKMNPVSGELGMTREDGSLFFVSLRDIVDVS